MSRRHAALLTLLLAGFPASALAHPSIDEQLPVLEQRSAGDPCDAHASLKRGDLYRAAREWTRAQQAYADAARCDPHLDDVDFARGLLSLEMGASTDARRFLDRFLAKHPGTAAALLARARVGMRAGQPAAAAADFSAAVALLRTPQPDYYVEWAHALLASAHPDEALRCLDQGIARLGMVPAMEALALDTEVGTGHFDAALQRLDGLPPPHEVWLLRRGEILEQAGRRDEARAAFAATLDVLASRPLPRRHVAAARELEQRARAALARLGDSAATTTP